MCLFNDCCYYLCCFGCCGICCKKAFVKKGDIQKKTENLRRLNQITPTDLKTMGSSIDPSNRLLTKVTTVHNVPNEKYKTDTDVIRGYGFRLEQFIDEGSFAQVYKAIHIETETEVAMKILKLPDASQNRRLIEMKNELYSLQRSQHPHLLRLIDHFMVVDQAGTRKMTGRLYIIMQLAKNGNLGTLLDKFGPFDENQCKVWFAQILSAVVFMHEKGIAHRDLKPHNILLDENRDCLISDFGLSRVLWRADKGGLIESSTYCGTQPFLAPEVLIKKNEIIDDSTQKSTYNAFLVDVWALGVILYQLFNKDYPFDVRNIPKAINRMRQKRWQFSGNNPSLPSDELRSILKFMLNPDTSNRPKASEVAKHQWIKKSFTNIQTKNSLLMKTSSDI